jgi:hypothetical protein
MIAPERKILILFFPLLHKALLEHTAALENPGDFFMRFFLIQSKL